MSDTLRSVCCDFEDKQQDIKKLTSALLIIEQSLEAKVPLKKDRYLDFIYLITDLSLDIENSFTELLNRLSRITDELYPKENKIAPETDQSTQG